MARAALLLLALVLASCAGGESGSDAEVLAFTVNRDGWNEIWTMAADGSDRVRLTEEEPRQNDAAGRAGPAWSPDGSRIAYSAQVGTLEEAQEGFELYVMGADGSDQQRLTTNDLADLSPAWSPDGTRIAFTRIDTSGEPGGIFALELETGRETRLTSARWPSVDHGPAWSPDGTMIAFARAAPRVGSVQLDSELVVLELETGEERRVTRAGTEPDWSPDGSRLAFTSTRDGNGRTCFHECGTSGEIYVVDVDGQGTTRLTMTTAADQSPAWSPDGESLAFVSDRSNPSAHEYELYLMDASGGHVTQLTENGVWDLEPAWRP
jgi:Tol biopolymer transport system component